MLDKLAKVGYKVLGNELLYDSHHFPFNHLGWLCPWGEWWWKVRTKVSAIIMMGIGGQTDVSEEICAYERRCLTRVNHDSSCIQCITTYTSLKMMNPYNIHITENGHDKSLPVIIMDMRMIMMIPWQWWWKWSFKLTTFRLNIKHFDWIQNIWIGYKTFGFGLDILWYLKIITDRQWTPASLPKRTRSTQVFHQTRIGKLLYRST